MPLREIWLCNACYHMIIIIIIVHLFILVQVYSQHRPVGCYVLLGERFSLLWGTLEVLGSIAAL